MGSINAVFVRAGENCDQAARALEVAFPAAEVTIHENVVRAELSELPSSAMEVRLLSLSKELDAEVFWITYQSVVDAFQYHHWNAGQHLRSLVYGCYWDERTWERVEGTPEAWEKDVLFDPEKLESLLPFYESAEERSELERVWREQDLEPGEIEPGLIADECASRVLERLKLL